MYSRNYSFVFEAWLVHQEEGGGGMKKKTDFVKKI
jgi:hypothetical protein